MHCPLCGGPLHVDDARQLVCERGHAMGPEQARTAAAARVTTALWMAIEALESEATVRRTLHPGGDGDEDGLASQAEEDARVLRRLAGAHVPAGHDVPIDELGVR